MNYSIQFLRDLKGYPVGCLAIRYGEVTENGTRVCSYQFSTRNPADKFDRKTARQLSIGRLVESPIPLVVAAKSTKHEVVAEIMRCLIANKKVPSRTRKAARHWLTSFLAD